MQTATHPDASPAQAPVAFAAWDESKHPRGQPANKGEFGPGGGGKSAPESLGPGSGWTREQAAHVVGRIARAYPHATFEVVGSVATKGQSAHDLDVLMKPGAGHTFEKLNAALEGLGLEYQGQSLLSPKEAKGQKKAFAQGVWSELRHYKLGDRKVEIWAAVSAPAKFAADAPVTPAPAGSPARLSVRTLRRLLRDAGRLSARLTRALRRSKKKGPPAPAEAEPAPAAFAFCPTGEGGGIDPTCSPHGKAGGGKEPHELTLMEYVASWEAGLSPADKRRASTAAATINAAEKKLGELRQQWESLSAERQAAPEQERRALTRRLDALSADMEAQRARIRKARAGRGRVHSAELMHRSAVESALRAGKHVPPKVLKDYPDLKPSDYRFAAEAPASFTPWAQETCV